MPLPTRFVLVAAGTFAACAPAPTPGTSVQYHDLPDAAAATTTPSTGSPQELPPGLVEAWVRITIKLRMLQASYGPRLDQARRMGDDAAFAKLRAEADAAAAAFLAGEPWSAADLAQVPAALDADPRLAAEAEAIAQRLAAEAGFATAATRPPVAAGAMAAPTVPVVP
jgi:hypothetical protein